MIIRYRMTYHRGHSYCMSFGVAVEVPVPSSTLKWKDTSSIRLFCWFSPLESWCQQQHSPILQETPEASAVPGASPSSWIFTITCEMHFMISTLMMKKLRSGNLFKFTQPACTWKQDVDHMEGNRLKEQSLSEVWVENWTCRATCDPVLEKKLYLILVCLMGSCPLIPVLSFSKTV